MVTILSVSARLQACRYLVGLLGALAPEVILRVLPCGMAQTSAAEAALRIPFDGTVETVP